MSRRVVTTVAAAGLLGLLVTGVLLLWAWPRARVVAAHPAVAVTTGPGSQLTEPDSKARGPATQPTEPASQPTEPVHMLLSPPHDPLSPFHNKPRLSTAAGAHSRPHRNLVRYLRGRLWKAPAPTPEPAVATAHKRRLSPAGSISSQASSAHWRKAAIRQTANTCASSPIATTRITRSI